MNKFITSLSLFAALTLGAQNGELHIHVTMDQNLAGATWTNTTKLDFSSYGSDFNDGWDMTSVITNNSIAHPFTLSASGTPLLVRDARPHLYGINDYDFGIWNTAPGDLHIQAEWAYPNDSLLYNVTFIENANQHNLY